MFVVKKCEMFSPRPLALLASLQVVNSTPFWLPRIRASKIDFSILLFETLLGIMITCKCFQGRNGAAKVEGAG